MRVVWGHAEIIVPMVAHLAHTTDDYGPCVTAGVVDNGGNLIAGVVFHNYDAEAGVIECSGAAVNARWCVRSVLRELMRYVFDTVGCQMVMARTAADNKAVRRLGVGLGAVEHIIPRMKGRDADGVFLCVTDDAWLKSRLNEVRHGNESTETAPAA